MSETHPLEGEIVEVRQIACATRGYYIEFEASIWHDDTQIFIKPSFGRDVARLFNLAGFNMVVYNRGHNIPVPNVSVILGVKKGKRGRERYTIEQILSIDGETWHKLEEVYEADRVRRQSKPSAPKRTAEQIKRSYICPSTLARMDKRKANEERFKHGSELIRWHLNENPYSVVEMNGEYTLVIDSKKLATYQDKKAIA